MIGFLLIDKPLGLTSHDVVHRLRRVTGVRRIGHSGTLDPAATGLLIMAVGGATKLLQHLPDQDKDYWCSARLGATSTTDDAEGEIAPTDDAAPLERETVEAALAGFRGELEQRPPAFSAVKIEGRKLYELARKGQAVEAPARRVTVYELALTRFDYPDFELEMSVSSGTYVRSLVRDLGGALGQGGYVTGIRRTAIGVHSVADAAALDDVLESPEAVTRRLIDPSAMLRQLPAPRLDDAQQLERLLHGNPVELDAARFDGHAVECGAPALVLSAAGETVALAEITAINDSAVTLAPRKVLKQR